jgi:hypothetical protein
MGLGTELSPEVASALGVVLAEVERQLNRWTAAGGAALPEAAEETSGTEQLREHI